MVLEQKIAIDTDWDMIPTAEDSEFTVELVNHDHLRNTEEMQDRHKRALEKAEEAIAELLEIEGLIAVAILFAWDNFDHTLTGVFNAKAPYPSIYTVDRLFNAAQQFQSSQLYALEYEMQGLRQWGEANGAVLKFDDGNQLADAIWNEENNGSLKAAMKDRKVQEIHQSLVKKAAAERKRLEE